MISRKTWTEAIASSTLPASVRAVLREMATAWPHGTTRPTLTHEVRQESWQKALAARTGLSEATVKRAWRAAERAGFLVLVTARRQHYAPVYAPTIPTPQTGHGDRSEESQGGHGDRSGVQVPAPRPVTESPQTGQPDRSLIGGELQNTTTTSAPLADAGSALVVVGKLPKNLAQQVGRSQLAKALGSARANGWTAELLAAAAAGHDWSGARGGAVITWARELGPAPQPEPAPAPARVCDVHGTTYRTVCAGCRADALAGTG